MLEKSHFPLLISHWTNFEVSLSKYVGVRSPLTWVIWTRLLIGKWKKTFDWKLMRRLFGSEACVQMNCLPRATLPPIAWWPMILSVFINDHKSDKIPQDRPKCRLSYETDGRSEIPKTEKSWSFVAEMVPILYTFPGPTTAAATQIELWYEEVNTSARYAAARSLIA